MVLKLLQRLTPQVILFGGEGLGQQCKSRVASLGGGGGGAMFNLNGSAARVKGVWELYRVLKVSFHGFSAMV